jgi:PKD repeat protein
MNHVDFEHVRIFINPFATWFIPSIFVLFNIPIMKRILLICLVVFASFAANAQATANDLVIQGYVTASVQNLAQQGYPVYVSLNNNLLQTVYTNANGWYSMLIVGGSVIGPNQIYTVYTEDSCSNAILSQSISNNQGTIDEASASFVVCANASNTCNSAFELVINGNSVTGINQSNGTLLSSVWSVNGVTVSNFDNLTFDNAEPGTYEICLHVVSGTTDPLGCEDTHCESIVISGDTTNTECYAFFTSEISATNPLRALLNGSSSMVEEGAIYSWDFGDNSTANTMNAEHTYNQAGVYNVCLTVFSGSCSNTYCQEVSVPGNNSNACNAGFSWVQTNTNPAGTEGLAEFSAEGTNQGNLLHVWYVNGDFQATSTNPSIGFNLNQAYTVCHTVYNTVTACSDSVCQTITLVGDTLLDCNASFSWSISQANPLRALLLNQSTPGMNTNASFAWDLGDGSSASTFNVEHTYAEAGTYTVCLTITSNNCSNTYCEEVSVTGSTSSSFAIGGQVFAGNASADIGSVRLYAIDQTSNAVEWVQTAPIDSGYYFFDNIAAGTYIIKAGLSENSEYYGTYVPTYFGSQFYWFNAEVVSVSENGFTYNISLIYASNPGGNGIVNGDIDDGPYRLSGASGTSSASTLVSSADVFVTDLVGNPQRYTVTNASGQFQVSNLAYGTYRLFSDIPGMLCVPVEFSLSPETPEVMINLVMGDLVTSLVTANEAISGDVYPNPVADIAHINLNLASSQDVNVSLIAADGKTVYSSTQVLQSGKQVITIPTTSIANGFYFLKLIGLNNHVISVRKISVTH